MIPAKNEIGKDLWVATCQSGLENVLDRELNSLGIEVKEIQNSVVIFLGDHRDTYRANIHLRTALHILKPLRKFQALNYDMVYHQARKIHWHKLFPLDKTIRIDIKGKSDIFKHSQYLKHRVKDAILDTFRKFSDQQRPSIDKREPDIEIIVHVSQNQLTIYLDSSGIPLFKRGYRLEHSPAPIKEDLAAGILLLSDWDKKSSVLDPMCGSGTFLIEAYMIANQIPPNLERNFSFMNWANFDRRLFLEVKEQSRNQIQRTDTEFFGYEIDPEMVKMANAILSRLKIKKIKVAREDFRKSKTVFDRIFVVSNPPYGERLKTGQDLKEFYGAIGDYLKQKCPSSRASIFTANLKDSKFIGLKTKARIKLYNGPLEGRLLKFDIY